MGHARRQWHTPVLLRPEDMCCGMVCSGCHQQVRAIRVLGDQLAGLS